MLARISSFGLNGLEAYPVAIETDISPGLPNITVVGLPDNAIKESRERIRAAIRNSGFEFPAHRITINLAPADTKKQGTSVVKISLIKVILNFELTIARFSLTSAACQFNLKLRYTFSKSAFFEFSLTKDAFRRMISAFNCLSGYLCPTFSTDSPISKN